MTLLILMFCQFDTMVGAQEQFQDDFDLVIIDDSFSEEPSDGLSSPFNPYKKVKIREIIVYVDGLVSGQEIIDDSYIRKADVLIHSPLREGQELSVEKFLRRIKTTKYSLQSAIHLDSKSIVVDYEIVGEDILVQLVDIRIFADTTFMYGWNGGNAFASMYFLRNQGTVIGVHLGATRIGAFYDGYYIPSKAFTTPLWRLEYGIKGEFLWIIPAIHNSADDDLHYSQVFLDAHLGIAVSPAYKFIFSQKLQLGGNRSDFQALEQWSSLTRFSFLSGYNFSGTGVLSSYVRSGLHAKISVSDFDGYDASQRKCSVCYPDDISNVLYWLAFDLEGQIAFKAFYHHALHARFAGQFSLNGNSDLPEGLSVILEKAHFGDEHERSMLYMRTVDGSRPSRGVNTLVTGLEYYAVWPIGTKLALGALFYADIASLQYTPKDYELTNKREDFMIGFGPGLYVDIANPVNIRVKLGVGFVRHGLNDEAHTGFFIDVSYKDYN